MHLYQVHASLYNATCTDGIHCLYKGFLLWGLAKASKRLVAYPAVEILQEALLTFHRQEE